MAASFAINAKEAPEEVLRRLEMGRGVVGGLIFDVRVELPGLKPKFPHLANEFSHHRDELDSPHAPDHPCFTGHGKSNAEDPADCCVDVATVVYKTIRSSRVNRRMMDESVSRGLHSALRQLCDSVHGHNRPQDIEPCDPLTSEDVRRVAWVPFVHYGP